MKVTTGGRVAIPAHIRRLAGFKPGDDLDFAIEGSAVCVVRAPQGQPRKKRSAQRSGRTPRVRMTTDEIMALLGDRPT